MSVSPLKKAPLTDSFGRVHRSLRVSVTDRCNMRCQYCMPAIGLPCAPRSELLSFEEIALTVGVAASMGVDRIRITGGEPLLRRDLPDLIALIKSNPQVADVAMTTNALLLDRHAQALADAGLDRINISLDSLDPEKFSTITRNGILDRVWKGLEAAAKAGIKPIRINTLLLAGFNDDEVDHWIEFTKKYDIDVRFMELMPIGEGAKMAGLGEFLNLTNLKERLIKEKGLEPADGGIGNGPARYIKAPGARGRIGFITPLSNSYCNTCSRMRLTSTGELRACLAFDEQLSIRDAVRAGDKEQVEALFRQAVAKKPAGHHWQSGQTTQSGMSALGG